MAFWKQEQKPWLRPYEGHWSRKDSTKTPDTSPPHVSLSFRNHWTLTWIHKRVVGTACGIFGESSMSGVRKAPDKNPSPIVTCRSGSFQLLLSFSLQNVKNNRLFWRMPSEQLILRNASISVVPSIYPIKINFFLFLYSKSELPSRPDLNPTENLCLD